MEITDAIRERVNFLLKQKGLTKYQLEQKSGIPHGTLSSLMDGKTNDLQFKNILKLAKGFNMSLIEFLDDGKILVENFNLDD